MSASSRSPSWAATSERIAIVVKPQLKIHHPEPGAAVRPTHYIDNGTPYYFVPVFGRAHGFKNLVASLVSLDNTVILKGTPIKLGMHWVVGLLRLPTSEKTYHLLVGQTDNDKGPHLVATVEFTVLATPAASDKRGNIPINSPLAGGSICPTFTAWGSLYQNRPTTGATMNSISGADLSLTKNLPPGIWMYQFNNLPEDSGYTFTVTDGVPADTSVNDDITVDASACAPPVGA
jgi:hypothetical protein